MHKLSQQKELKEFNQIKNIDLCQALKGTPFSAHINMLFDTNEIIENLEVAFANLDCEICGKQAEIVYKGNEETPEQLYCKTHFYSYGFCSLPSLKLSHELRLHKVVLKDLERLMILLQERMEYFYIEDNKKDPVPFGEAKDSIDESFKQLQDSLKSLNSKIKKVNKDSNTKKNYEENKLKYESLSFVMYESEK